MVKHLRVALFCIFVSFGGFLFGYDIGVISGCLVMPDFIQRFGELKDDGEWYLSATRQALITSLLSAGTFVGSLAQAFTSDKLGRKWSIFSWTATFTVGTVIQTAANKALAQMLVGRFIAGLGVGALSAIVPLYNGETAPKKYRGTALVLYQLNVILGLFISYCVDLGTHDLEGSVSWRTPVGLQLAWGIILMTGLLFLPDSPRYLLGQGREADARRAIASLNEVDEYDPLVEGTIVELAEGLREENQGGKAGWLECFSHRNMLYKRTINGMMLQFIQQLNGQNFYYYYGPTFFKSAGLPIDSLVIQTILGGVSLAATIPALYLLDKFGRRSSLLFGAAFECACAIIAASVGHTMLAPDGTPSDQLTTSEKQGGQVLVAFAVLHVAGFSMFWGPGPWAYLGESFPLRVRSKCVALGAATNWIWNFLLSYFSPDIAEDIGPLILLIFAGMLAFGFVYVWLFVPEVRGLSLEQIDELYRAKIKPWHSSNWQPTTGTGKNVQEGHGGDAPGLRDAARSSHDAKVPDEHHENVVDEKHSV